MNQKAMLTLAALLLAAFTQTTPLVPSATASDRGPSATLAQTEAPEPGAKSAKRQTYPFRGKVASVDTMARTVTLEGRTSRRVIAVTDDTRLTREGAVARLEEIKPGEAVGGTLRKSAEGREIATLIRVGLKPKEKASPGAGADDAGGPGEG